MHEVEHRDSDSYQPQKTPEQSPKELMEPHDQTRIALFRELAKRIRLRKEEGRNDVEAANRLSELIGIDIVKGYIAKKLPTLTQEEKGSLLFHVVRTFHEKLINGNKKKKGNSDCFVSAVVYPFESEEYNPFKYLWGIVKTIIRYYPQYILMDRSKERPTDHDEIIDLMAEAIQKNPDMFHLFSGHTDSPDMLIYKRQLLDLIKINISKLTKIQQIILVWWSEDIPYSEMSIMLEIAIATCRSHKRDAINKIRIWKKEEGVL